MISTLALMAAIRRDTAPALLSFAMIEREIAAAVAAYVQAEREEQLTIIRIAHLFAPRSSGQAPGDIELPADCEWGGVS